MHNKHIYLIYFIVFSEKNQDKYILYLFLTILFNSNLLFQIIVL